MIQILKTIIRSFQVSWFGAQVSGALFDLAVDAKKLDQKEFAAKCAESFGKSNPNETASMMFCTNAVILHKMNALVFPLELQDFLIRGSKVIGMWAKERKVSADLAEPLIGMLEELSKIRPHT